MMFKKIFVFIIIFSIAYCSSYQVIEYQINHNPPIVLIEKNQRLTGSVTIVDITPPPDMPLAGYSLNAISAKGFRHKLKARIFILTNSKNHTIVFVQMDLLSGSKLLHHKVAEIISKDFPIGFSDIAIFGTHTHAGPGNYFESIFYNNFASNKAGFEPNYFEFLVNQIVDGIKEGWKNRQPVKIAFGRKELYGFTKNRSFKAYLKNPNIPENTTKETAINPWIEMIRIDSINQKPIGVITNFSIHPTVIPEANIFYHADVFGYIEKGLEDYVKEYYHINTFIHGALNYTHGDLTPNYNDDEEEGDFVIAKEIGIGISKEMFELFQSLENQFVQDIELNSHSMEIDIAKTSRINQIEICNYAVVGMSLTTGATTRSTPILKYLPYFRPEWPRWFFTDGCQGEKRWFLSKLQHLFLPKEEFPQNLYFQAIQIGNYIYLPYPFEITTQTGNLIRTKIQEQYKNFHIIPVSCANGYTGYVTTPQEYSLQYYEGGHTLYGKNTAPFLAEIGLLLTSNLFSSKKEELPEKFTFKLKAKNYYPEKKDLKLIQREIDTPPTFKKQKKESYWFFRYWDVPLYYLNLHQPILLLEKSHLCKEDFKNFRDENSLDLSLHYIKNSREKTLYEARWYIPTQNENDFKNHCYRFRILKRYHLNDFLSPSFKIE